MKFLETSEICSPRWWIQNVEGTNSGIDLGVGPPSQDASEHQDYYMFRFGDPELNLHLITGILGGGPHPRYSSFLKIDSKIHGKQRNLFKKAVSRKQTPLVVLFLEQEIS